KSVLEQFKANQDFVLLSPTGSGKTLAFSLLVSKLIQSDKALKTQTLVVVPTRELALQIETVIKKVITGYKVLCVYGGHDTKIERNALKEAPTIIIGTPGRIIYHRERNYISTGDRKSTRLNSSHVKISYAVFCLKKKNYY